MNPTVLTYNQPVRAARWMSVATVFSVEGCTRQWNREDAARKIPMGQQDVAAAVARAVRHGHDLASTIYTGGCLMANGPAKDRMIANAELAMEHAEVLEPGQLVEIEGRRYTVAFPQRGDCHSYPRFSDPIHFIPVEA